MMLGLVQIDSEALTENCAPVRAGQLRVLWFTGGEYEFGANHGGNLRYFNLARELIRAGHKVYFASQKPQEAKVVTRRKVLDALLSEKTISGYAEVEYHHPNLRGKVARFVAHPALGHAFLRAARNAMLPQVEALVSQHDINLLIISAPRFLFLLHAAERLPPVVLDWADSMTLYQIRQLRVNWDKRELLRLPRVTQELFEAFIAERFYGKRARLNIVVSPVDKAWLDGVNRCPAKNRVLLNGINPERSLERSTKKQRRLIFTGNMMFPPNYEAALWFIDHVMPRLVALDSEVKFVVAGASPVEELRRRASRHIEVTGFVEDMAAEIKRSSLYVAPLISGGGFKNKIVEAMTCETFTIGTSLAFEFLDNRLRRLVTIANTPEEFATAIGSYFENPENYNRRAAELKQIVDREFTWENRAAQLGAMAEEVVESSTFC